MSGLSAKYAMPLESDMTSLVVNAMAQVGFSCLAIIVVIINRFIHTLLKYLRVPFKYPTCFSVYYETVLRVIGDNSEIPERFTKKECCGVR